MKSSKDIRPRVGMQVRWYLDHAPKKIVRITPDLIECSDGVHHVNPALSHAWDWPRGGIEIEWTPPTDDERRLFMEAGRLLVEFRSHLSDGDYAVIVEDCERSHGDPVDLHYLPGRVRMRAIADSLALDGADYEDMPEGWE